MKDQNKSETYKKISFDFEDTTCSLRYNLKYYLLIAKTKSKNRVFVHMKYIMLFVPVYMSIGRLVNHNPTDIYTSIFALTDK